MPARIRIDSRKAVAALDGLSMDLAREVRDNSVERIGKIVFTQAFHNLSGGRGDPPGSYPIPVRTGHLRRALYMILPNGTKLGEEGGDLYRVGPGTAFVGNSASYAHAIHEGAIYCPAGEAAWMSTPRPFLADAARDVLGQAKRICDEELEKAVRKHGLD